MGFGPGGEHTVTATGPVRYEVEGFFYAESEGGCTFELVVTETLLFSKVLQVQSNILGALPTGPGGLGADHTTVFRPDFDEESRDFFIIAGGHTSSFSLYDIVAPDDAGCDFAR